MCLIMGLPLSLGLPLITIIQILFDLYIIFVHFIPVYYYHASMPKLFIFKGHVLLMNKLPMAIKQAISTSRFCNCSFLCVWIGRNIYWPTLPSMTIFPKWGEWAGTVSIKPSPLPPQLLTVFDNLFIFYWIEFKFGNMRAGSMVD